MIRARDRLELLDIAVLAGIGAHLVVSFASLDRESSLEASAIVLVYAATYWLARHVSIGSDLRRVATIAIVMALVFWIVVIAVTWVVEKVVDVRVFGWPPLLDAHQAYAWGSINTPPVLILLALPFVAWLPAGGFRRVILALLAVCALVIVPFSVGRAAWLGIAVAIVSWEVLTGFPLLGRMWRSIERRTRRPVRMIGGAIALAAVAVTVVRVGNPAVALDSRVRLWEQAAGLFAVDPLTGAGPTTFAWARLAHVPDFVDRVAARAAHNVPMQTLAEGGLLLAAALIFTVVAWGWTAFGARATLDRAQRMALAVLIGFAAFSLFDDFSFLPAVTVIVIVLAAWVLPPRTVAETGRRRGTGPLLVPAALAIGGVLTLPTVVSLGLMRVELEETRAAAVDGNWERALAGFESAARAQPANALHWMGIGLARDRLGDSAAALDAYETASVVSPGDPRPWGARAALADGEENVRLLREAARRSNVPQYAYRLGSALLADGDRAGAADAYAIAAVVQPTVYAVVPNAVREAVREELDDAVALVGSLAGRDPREAAWNAALARDEIAPSAPVQWHVARHIDAGEERHAAALLAVAMEAAGHVPRTWEAASALAQLRCQRTEFEAAESALAALGVQQEPGAHAVVVRRPGWYGLPDLGDYQPLSAPSLPELPRWPLGLIEVPDCGW